MGKPYDKHRFLLRKSYIYHRITYVRIIDPANYLNGGDVKDWRETLRAS